MKGRPVAAISVVVMLAATLAAEPMRVDVENVPVDRVVANLEQQVRERPADVDSASQPGAGARHGVRAKAHDDSDCDLSRSADRVSCRGSTTGSPEFQQFRIRTRTIRRCMAAAREHLTKAIARYREALELAPAHPVAQMGLGWTLSQSGDKARRHHGAAKSRRADPSRSQGPAHWSSYGFRTLIEEAMLYLVPLLDPRT